MPSATAFVTTCFGFHLAPKSVDGGKSVRVIAIAYFVSHSLSSHLDLFSYLAFSSHLIVSDHVSAHPPIVPYRALRPISINQSFPFFEIRPGLSTSEPFSFFRPHLQRSYAHSRTYAICSDSPVDDITHLLADSPEVGIDSIDTLSHEQSLRNGSTTSSGNPLLGRPSTLPLR